MLVCTRQRMLEHRRLRTSTRLQVVACWLVAAYAQLLAERDSIEVLRN